MPGLMAASSKSTATDRGQKGTLNQAIGTSKGGMTTKILALVDALGNLVGFRLLPGQCHDICGIEPLIRDREFGALLADKAFDADWLVKDLTERGSKVVIPPRSNRKAPREYDKEMYKWRHLVENFFCKLKRSRRLPCGQKRRVRLFPPTFIWLPLIVLRQCQQSLIN